MIDMHDLIMIELNLVIIRWSIRNVVPKCILSPEQLSVFQSAKTHQKVVIYIENLNIAVIGIK